MALDEGATGPVSSVLLAPFSSLGSNTVVIVSSQPRVFSLPVDPQPNVLSVPDPIVPLPLLSAVLFRAVSISDFARPSMPGVAQMDSTSADIASLFFASEKVLFMFSKRLFLSTF